VADEDDDDLMSLDFTVPGAFDTQPEPPAAPEIPAPPAAVAPPPAPEPPPRKRAPLPPALAEAAELYAAGKELDALRRLEAAIKSGEDLGDAALRAWGGLFELLQVLGRRPAFDALALTFARRFEKSPPAWNGVLDEGNTAIETTGGRAHVSLSGVLNIRVGEVLKQTMKLAATSSMVRMDVSKLLDVDNHGATLLLRGIAALKRAKKEFMFGSPEHLAKILASKLVPGERSNESMWLLMLELYQQAYLQDAFEEAAVNYAITFEVSPPSWEAVTKRRSTPSATAPVGPPKAEGFTLHDQLIGATASDFAPLEALLAGRDEYEIDARKLVRIDAASAGRLLDTLKRLHAKGKRLHITGLGTLVAAYLETLGFADVAELRAKLI
jgi:anti-anti-sigma regulatory factor